MSLENSEKRKNSSSPIASSEQKLNNIKRRFIILSPTVELGLERECTKFDFFRDGDKSVGKGGFGEVWKVVHRDTNKIYCIKIVDKRDIIEQRLINQLNIELEIMYKINHPHSVKLVNHFEDDDKFYFIMNFASKGTVFSYMKNNHKLDQKTAAQFLRDTISIIKYLHSFNPMIIHRDIKPENLLLDDNLRVELCDYGWACYLSNGEKIKTFCGTPEYVSPEMIKKQGHDHRVDIWSIGVLLFEMLAGYTPFLGNTKEDLYNNITKIKINWPNDFPTLAKNLIIKILKYDPNDRPTLEEISNHPWFEQNPFTRKEIINRMLSKKEILLSHIINDPSRKDPLDSSKRTLDQSCLSGLDFEKTKINSFKLSNEDLDLIPNDIDKVKNEVKSLKIQLINTDNLYREVLEENSDLLKIKKDFESLKEDFDVLTKELELYKQRDKDREILLLENEQKVNHIIQLYEEISSCKLDKVSFEVLNEHINSMKSALQIKDNLISDLNKQIIKISKNHHETIDLINKEGINNNITESKVELNDIKSLINKMSTQLNDKSVNLTQRIETNLSLYTTKDRELSSLIKHISNEVGIVISIIKDSMLQSINEIFNKFTFKSMKTFETIEWLNENIKKLQGYKGKSERLENKIKASINEIKILNERIEVYIKKEETDLNLISFLKDSLGTKDRKISHLEAKLCDLKNFMFRNSNNEVLDSFFAQFKGNV